MKSKEVNIIKQVPIRIDDELHRALKIIAIENNTSIQKIVEDFLKEYVKSHTQNHK